MTTEHLIEKARKAVLDNFHGPDDRHRSWWLNPENVARAVLAVFEEAHTPTNDEREELRRAIASVLWNAGNYPDRVQAALLGQSVAPLVMLVHDAVLAAGFRRSEVPEPPRVTTGEPVWDAASGERRDAYYADVLKEIGVPEPQGEPSDAQVRAAAESIARDDGQHIDVVPEWADAYMPIARAALRAAAEAGGVR